MDPVFTLSSLKSMVLFLKDMPTVCELTNILKNRECYLTFLQEI